MVRDAIARHVGHAPASRGPADPAVAARAPLHVSHLRLPLAAGAESDGVCLIEPAVHCTHCGYCQSYGH